MQVQGEVNRLQLRTRMSSRDLRTAVRQVLFMFHRDTAASVRLESQSFQRLRSNELGFSSSYSNSGTFAWMCLVGAWRC